MLWQNLFWFWGHPEVYILALPFFGVVSEIIPVFSRKPIFGYRGMVFATISIAALSTGVWAHHMFTTGTVLLPFFSGLSYLIAVPTGIKFFNWIGTMWRGQVQFTAAMLFCMGFLITFLIGGITGIFLASPPIDFATHDTYFVVAHFHSVVYALLLAAFASIYYWFPKFFGRMLDERLGKIHFWISFIGFNLSLAPQYILGLDGMPRRIAHYSPTAGWTFLNQMSSFAAFLVALTIPLLVYNIYKAFRHPIPAGDNPWDANTLEWATSSPPAHHNFESIPRIKSERPVWDMNHPEHPAIEHRKEATAPL